MHDVMICCVTLQNMIFVEQTPLEETQSDSHLIMPESITNGIPKYMFGKKEQTISGILTSSIAAGFFLDHYL